MTVYDSCVAAVLDEMELTLSASLENTSACGILKNQNWALSASHAYSVLPRTKGRN